MVNSSASISALAAVLAATGSSSDMEDLDLAELAQTPAQGDAQELTEVPAPVGCLDKPFEDYTTTEGLLLILIVLLVIMSVGDHLRRCTSWL